MQLLQERAKTHGDYELTAKVAQKIKAMIRNSPSYPDMNERQCESIEMIALKLARVMCGNPHEPDHWKDIAGYALLAVKGADNANA
jgi:hypothetical protein